MLLLLLLLSLLLLPFAGLDDSRASIAAKLTQCFTTARRAPIVIIIIISCVRGTNFNIFEKCVSKSIITIIGHMVAETLVEWSLTFFSVQKTF